MDMESADLEWSAEVGRVLLGGGALSTDTQGNRMTVSSARKGRHLNDQQRKGMQRHLSSGKYKLKPQ